MPNKPPASHVASAHTHTNEAQTTNEGRMHETAEAATERMTPLLNAAQLANWLNVSARRVYELPIKQRRISARSIRWDRQDVLDYIEHGTTEAA